MKTLRRLSISAAAALLMLVGLTPSPAQASIYNCSGGWQSNGQIVLVCTGGTSASFRAVAMCTNWWGSGTYAYGTWVPKGQKSQVVCGWGSWFNGVIWGQGS